MGRKKAYTAYALKLGINRYFGSISRHAVVRDDDGRAICNDDGIEIERIEYVIPPTITGICRYLGITRKTWANYSDEALHPDLAPICEDALGRVEEYLELQLVTREKGVQGIVFNLQNNFGWKNEKKLELSGSVQRDEMSLDEKLAEIERLIRDDE